MQPISDINIADMANSLFDDIDALSNVINNEDAMLYIFMHQDPNDSDHSIHHALAKGNNNCIAYALAAFICKSVNDPMVDGKGFLKMFQKLLIALLRLGYLHLSFSDLARACFYSLKARCLSIFHRASK